MKTNLLAACAALSFVAMSVPAGAAVFTFSGTGTASGGGAITTSGTFTTTDTMTNGAYTITGITGTFNNATISGLLAPGSFEINDNLLFASAPYLDLYGVSFTLASGASPVNYYYSSGYKYFRGANGTGSFSSFTVTPQAGAVPEPATWAMMVGGFGIVGVGMRRRTGRAIQAI